jgi:YebC/PmpR family DNA-binding regulatory protein
MPKDNIERAVKRGTGESKEGEVFEQIYYEGYAPHGVAVIIDCVTENKNRTVSEIRHIMTRSGGSMGEAGSVGWQFKRVAYFSIPVEGNSFDKVFELAVDGGGDDVTQEDDYFEVIGPVENFKRLSDKFREAKIDIEEGELRMIPNQTMDLGVDDTLQVLRAIDALEELDDVQHVFSTMNISQEALAALEAE